MEYSNEKEFSIGFVRNLRLLWKAKDFTQEQLANEIDVDISQINRIERGIINTLVSIAYNIAKVLCIKAGELFDR